MNTITVHSTQTHEDVRRQVIGALNQQTDVTIDFSSLEKLAPALLELLSSAAMKARAESLRLTVKCGWTERYERMHRMGWADMLELCC